LSGLNNLVVIKFVNNILPRIINFPYHETLCFCNMKHVKQVGFPHVCSDISQEYITHCKQQLVNITKSV